MKKWYKRIPTKGLLCHVSDLEENPVKYHKVRRIVKYEADRFAPFVGQDELAWRYATPAEDV